MKRDAILHNSRDNMCYQSSPDEIVISIQTGKDITSVEIQWGDPFEAGIMGGAEAWSGKTEKLTDVLELENHLWWSIRLKPPYKRCKYFFTIESRDERLCYFEDGFYGENELHIPGKRMQCFFFPWMNSSDFFETPKWVEDAVWYQIFPERFARVGEYEPHLKPWKSEKIRGFNYKLRYGGNLKGVTSRLEYLHNLGITAIYFNPIFKSPTDHKYNIDDYYEIDEEFGTKDDFRELCSKAHSLGIKIMLDMVLNHSGINFPPFADLMKNGERSKYRDWYMVNKFPITLNKETRDGRFYSFAFTQFMPKLNTNNPEVMDYFAGVCEYWVKQFGVDGLRFDVANEVSHKFLKLIRSRVKAINPDVYLLAEIWHDSTQWLRGDEFDSIMNYPLTETISGFWLNKALSSKQLEQGINRCAVMYPEQSSRVMFNLLDSHDTERLYYRCGHDEDIFFQHLTLLFSLYGSPCIYYGTEIMLDGAHDPDCRRCMPWDEIDSGKYDGIMQQVKTLIKARKENPELKSLNTEFVGSGDNRHIRMIKDKRVLVAVNADSTPMKLEYSDIIFARGLNANTLECGGCAICRV
ncbi:glycoside hydrolase family 13 protein [Ruminococcus sp. zg-924]|uniref:glycoside hydrolase family 13 protein n=1 Tax=Ruminococcus sp. zg-924 TaxID=2678505 RepID=UPI0021089A52|nr:glycoside hydrolase family 13 protein [Ruminococcus sp. zg-924]MCQ4022189.1 alpha-glycosidase [Ruminococcus sp. zg-924]